MQMVHLRLNIFLVFTAITLGFFSSALAFYTKAELRSDVLIDNSERGSYLPRGTSSYTFDILCSIFVKDQDNLYFGL